MTATAFRFAPLAIAAALLLSSCSGLSPESRLRAGLVEAGLSPKMAGCMAGRMADRLSIGQLRKLQSVASLRKSHTEDLTIDHFIRKVRALHDPEIIAVTSKAAFICAF